jgi:hypothetical protein
MLALSADLDLRQSLRDVDEVGAAYVPNALSEPFRQQLQGEVEAGPFEPLPEQMGPVQTQADLFVVRENSAGYPAVEELRTQLVTLVREHGAGVGGLDRWWPNEAYVQRYRPGTLGVSPHLDSKRFSYLVAVFTTAGTARFALCSDRAGITLWEWEAGPGSLVLLRGPGFGGVEDGRPFHTVHGPTKGLRFSVTFRMNALST